LFEEAERMTSTDVNYGVEWYMVAIRSRSRTVSVQQSMPGALRAWVRYCEECE